MMRTETIPATAPAPQNNARVNNFNIVRFVASVMVIYGHMMHIMGEPIFTVYQQAVSTIAVKIFFVISGYLITKSFFSDGHFGRYMMRRVFRIFPGLIGVVLVTVFVVGPLTTTLSVSGYFSHPLTWNYFKNILLCPVYSLPGCFADYTYPNAVNGSFWTLPVEFAMYLLLPLWVVVFRKLKCLKAGIAGGFILFAILDVAHAAFFPNAYFVLWGSNLPDALSLIPYFFAGAFFTFPETRNALRLQPALALIAVGALINFSTIGSEIWLLFALPYFILSFSLAPQPAFGNCFAHCDFSYGLYLYGFMIQQVVWNALKDLNAPFLTLNVVTIICFGATLLCAVASWYLVEKPMQMLCKKLLRSKQIPAPQRA